MNLTQTLFPNCIAFCVDKKGVCSAWVRAVALVFEKSATELKHKQNLNVKAHYILWHLTLEL